VVLVKFNCSHTELVDLHKLAPNPRNPNKHPDKQIELLAKIIDYQGQRAPVVVSKRSGFIVKGHGRLLALQKLGWEKAAVDFQDHESEAQEFQDMVADNKIAELAEHDDLKMLEGLKDLELEDSDFELLGLDDFQMINPIEVDLPELEAGEPDCQQVTFIISNEQKDILDEGLSKAKKELDCTDEINENSNGNALAALVKLYVNS